MSHQLATAMHNVAQPAFDFSCPLCAFSMTQAMFYFADQKQQHKTCREQRTEELNMQFASLSN